jgi:hypothetical protein
MTIKWASVLARAIEIVDSYNTPVTLRQLFYRLVSEGRIRNSRAAYVQLSKVSAAARRGGGFPSLLDQTREIHRLDGFDSVKDAVDYLKRVYRRDHNENQEYVVYLGVEKKTMLPQLESWFRDYGVAIIPFGGYSSQTYVDDIVDDVDGRDAVLIYAGDFDPSGLDILRDFEDRCDCFYDVRRVALNHEQLQEYNLPVNAGKISDSRAAGFVRDYGELVQVELEALDPNVLRELYTNALFEFYDTSIFHDVLEHEGRDMKALRKFAATYDEGAA